MSQLSIGTIEVMGLPAAVEAADVALKTADITLIGYETTDGMGMVAVKIEGRVSAVQAAVAAASAAAGRVSKVFATSVIARPSEQLPQVVFTAETVGYTVPTPAPEPAPVEAAPAPEATPEPAVVQQTVVEPAPTHTAEPLVEPAETIVAPVTEVSAASASVTPRSTSRTRSTKK